MKTIKTVGVACALALACACAGQQKPTTIQGVATMTSLDDIMRLNASKIGGSLGKREKTSFTDAELADVRAGASYVIAIGKRLSTHFSLRKKLGAGFKMFADQLARDAAKLVAAAEAKNGPEVGAALKSLKATCDGCHAKYQH